MIVFELSIWSFIFGAIFGIAIAFFVVWLVDKQMSKDDQHHIGFSQGWDCGFKYGRETKGESE